MVFGPCCPGAMGHYVVWFWFSSANKLAAVTFAAFPCPVLGLGGWACVGRDTTRFFLHLTLSFSTLSARRQKQKSVIASLSSISNIFGHQFDKMVAFDLWTWKYGFLTLFMDQSCNNRCLALATRLRRIAVQLGIHFQVIFLIYWVGQNVFLSFSMQLTEKPKIIFWPIQYNLSESFPRLIHFYGSIPLLAWSPNYLLYSEVSTICVLPSPFFTFPFPTHLLITVCIQFQSKADPLSNKFWVYVTWAFLFCLLFKLSRVSLLSDFMFLRESSHA